MNDVSLSKNHLNDDFDLALFNWIELVDSLFIIEGSTGTNTVIINHHHKWIVIHKLLLVVSHNIRIK